MKKEDVYNAIVSELMVSPEKLEKFLDSFGTLGSWFIFHHVKENNTKIEALEKRFYALRRETEDLEVTVKKLQGQIRSLKQANRKNDKPLLD
jgi:chromosome segregation ATPase